jgi:hypothetical protein
MLRQVHPYLIFEQKIVTIRVTISRKLLGLDYFVDVVKTGGFNRFLGTESTVNPTPSDSSALTKPVLCVWPRPWTEKTFLFTT